MTTTLLIHGLNGSGEGHWQRHWLEDDADAIMVEQADPSRPDLDAWLEALEQALLRHPGSLIVAHSLGTLLAARLGTRPTRHLVKGALLVAPCDLARVDSLHPGVIKDAADVALEKLSFPTTVVGSHNDPYIGFADAQRFAAKLGAEFVDLGHAGHINVASGYGRWDKGYRLAARLERHDYARPSFSPPRTLGIVSPYSLDGWGRS